MPEYALYLESGPQQRKTQVHVLDLLGCIAQGPTTEATLAATPAAIQAWLRFVQRHGEPVDPAAPFTTRVAAHVMQGAWLSNGDPTPGFGLDFAPLSAAELDPYLRHLAWLGADLADLIGTIPLEQRAVAPEGSKRSIQFILEHLVEAQANYLHNTVGKVDDLVLRKAVRQGTADLPAVLADLWHLTGTRLAAMTEAERNTPTQHGRVTWTARRGLRRMLEHGWEHYQELARRVV